MAQADHLTEQQKKWFASVAAGLERDTGKTLKEWAAIAKTCPFDKPRARQQWLKEEHGLGQNRASLVLAEAFPSKTPWNKPDALIDGLWKDVSLRKIYDAIAARALKLDGAIATPRKTFSGFARKNQFAAARPVKGVVRLGLAVEPDASPRLGAPKTEGWSERLHAVTELSAAKEVDAELGRLLKAAWERS
ncbi:MAG: DUF4287 domain-containing protein [Maricaulaceae bacterium]|jgi:hypothetical protein